VTKSVRLVSLVSPSVHRNSRRSESWVIRARTPGKAGRRLAPDINSRADWPVVVRPPAGGETRYYGAGLILTPALPAVSGKTAD